MQIIPADSKMNGAVNDVIDGDGFMMQSVMVRVPDDEREMREAVCPDEGTRESVARDRDPPSIGNVVISVDFAEMIEEVLDAPAIEYLLFPIVIAFSSYVPVERERYFTPSNRPTL
jgi:hypothetical protein